MVVKIIESICIDSLELLEALAAEMYNKKHNKYSYFNNIEQLTNAIIADCPKYGLWWLKNKQYYPGIYFCYLRTNGKDVDPAIERVLDWQGKTIKIDQSIITAGKKRMNKIKQKVEIPELNMDKDPSYSSIKAKAFYQSDEWQQLRYKALQEAKGKCCLCGRSVKDGIILHVDHIVPLSVSWGLRNKLENLQVLCNECNLGKLNKDITSWK